MRIEKLFLPAASVLLLFGVALAADVFETEPLNDTCPGEPYSLGDTYHGALTLVDGDIIDEDWLCFPCEEGHLITAETGPDDAPTADTVIELYDDTCGNLLISDNDSGSGLYSLINGFEAPYTGNYYLKITAFKSTSIGYYQAVITCTEPVSVEQNTWSTTKTLYRGDTD